MQLLAASAGKKHFSSRQQNLRQQKSLHLVYRRTVTKELKYGTKCARMDQIKFFKGCIQQILLGLL